MIGGLQGQAGGVAARSRQARGEAGTDRIGRSGKYNRDDRRYRLYRGEHPSRRENDIDLEPDELRRHLSSALRPSLSPAIFDRDGAAFDPAELREPAYEGGRPCAPRCSRRPAQNPHGRQSRLLRARRKRPRDCTA